MEVGTVIALLISAIGLVFSILTFIYSRSNDKFYRKIEEDRRREEIEKKNRAKFNARPQFKTIEVKEFLAKDDGIDNDCYTLDVFFLPYANLDVDEKNYTPLYEQKPTKRMFKNKEKETSDNFNNVVVQGEKTLKKPICKYVDVYDKKDEWICYKLVLKNIGKSNIDSLYLLSQLERVGSIVYGDDKTICSAVIDTNSCQFTCIPKRNKVEKNDDIRIKISFHEDYVPRGFEVGFVLKMMAEDGSCWEQVLSFITEDDLNSREISNENYYAYLRGEYLDAVMYDRVYWEKKNRNA